MELQLKSKSKFKSSLFLQHNATQYILIIFHYIDCE